MGYKRPEDIDIIFNPLLWSDEKGLIQYPEEEKNILKAIFQEIAFHIFILKDHGKNRIGDYAVIVSYHPVNSNDIFELYHVGKCIFKMEQCNNGAWLVEEACNPESTQMFCNMVDKKFGIDNDTEEKRKRQQPAGQMVNAADHSNANCKGPGQKPDFDKTKDIFGNPLKESYPGLFELCTSAEDEEAVYNRYWAMVRHVDKDIFHRE